MSNADMDKAAAQAAASARAQTYTPTDIDRLAGYIRSQYELMRLHRDNPLSGWAERLLRAMRSFNGQYDPDQLREIRKFGGSEIFARITAIKSRGASSLLRDVYLGTDRPWGLKPDQDPKLPQAIHTAIQQLIDSEITGAMQAGQPADPGAIRDRFTMLTEAARQAAKKKAAEQARIAEEKLDEILTEGGFYKALAEFIVDLPLFPYAAIKGPTVRILPEVVWKSDKPGAPPKAVSTDTPKLCWQRVSPFDLYWTPGVSDIENANCIERIRLTRSELNDLLDLPGYNHDAVREVLSSYGTGGISDDWDITDSSRAVYESREDPRMNRSGLINCLEFQGTVQGMMLLDYGLPPEVIDDPVRDYFINAWLIGSYVIKAQLAPSPRKRHQYYVTSFEKVPGTPVGNGLPDILADIQDASNSALRALVNNMAMASGPQVEVNDDRLSDDEDGEDLYPWKRWHTRNDPMGNNQQPAINFFQPNSNAQELLTVYSQFVNMADEHSAVPRYMTGGQAGAVGRTASGLSMLMSNASKILQTVAANIDREVIDPALHGLYDMVMLTDDSQLLTGEEEIQVSGVGVAIQKETERSRQLEFLAATANPIDMGIIGPKGRAAILRPVADTLGLPGEQIVPTDDQMEAQQKQAQQTAQQQGQVGHSQGGDQAQQAQGNQPGSNVTQDTGPRTRIAGGH
jgi:hypothetical protein